MSMGMLDIAAIDNKTVGHRDVNKYMPHRVVKTGCVCVCLCLREDVKIHHSIVMRSETPLVLIL
jgi:hypothetical protein